MNIKSGSLAASIALACGVPALAATSLPPAAASLEVTIADVSNGNPTTIVYQTTLSDFGDSAELGNPYGQASVTSSLTKPSASASAQSSSNDFYYRGQFFGEYQVEVTGASNMYVPLKIAASVSATGATDPAGLSEAAVGETIYYPNQADVTATDMAGHPLDVVLNACVGRQGPGNCSAASTPTSTYNGTQLVLSDTPIDVLFQIDVDATGANKVSATADPFFQIDPSYADAKDFSLAFSNGVVNQPASAVPEPSAWALLMGGLAGLGMALRAHRRAPRHSDYRPFESIV